MNDNIDLLYLTNQHFVGKYDQQKQTSKNSKQLIEDIEFYRKRIFSNTKDMLRGKTINNPINDSFYNYAQELIKYFKFTDKQDILQEEYTNLKEKTAKIDQNFKLSDQNQIITRETKQIKTIEDYIPITVKKKKKKKINYPKKRIVDIKNPKFRIKGLEKEKSKQFICPEKQKDVIQKLEEKKNQIVSQNTKTLAKKKSKKKAKKKAKAKNKNLVAEILGNM
tara:strand:+ start:590 stop:1255 length:666 start_codon:yes stop_codon:yes gene_type:complete